MRVGDLIEIVGAVCLTVAAYLYLGLPGALAVGGIALVYEAQCLSTIELPRREAKRNLADARAQLELALATPGFFPDDIQRLREQVEHWEAHKGGLPVKLELPALFRHRRVKQLD